MKKILLILCLFPIFVFSQKSYKIPADSTILNNIGSGKNELVIRNATSNITGGVLTNLGNGVTAFVLGGGGASSSLFPNGLEFITESRDFLATDADKLLVVIGDSITLQMPEGVTFTQGQTFGIFCVGTGNSFNQVFEGELIEPLPSNSVEGGELVYVTVTSEGSNDILSSVASAYVGDKTLNKYLYDQSQNAIPLSGTEEGKPVTGDIEFDQSQNIGLFSGANLYFRFYTEEAYNEIGGYTVIMGGSGSSVALGSSNGGLPTGIAGDADYSANITDLDYTQKIYVDNAISSNRKVDTSYIFRNATLDSTCMITVINGNSYRSCAKDSVGSGTAYTFSTGLTNTSSTITNNLSTGVSGGQSVIGGTASGENLTLSSTTNATKGKILFGTSAYDEVNNRLGIGTTVPPTKLSVVSGSITGSGASDATIQLRHATENVGHSTAIEFSFGNGNNSYCGSRILGETASGGGGNLHFQTGSSSLGTYSTKMYIEKAGNVGIGTTTPAASAILDLTSTTKGLKLPTMTSTQASAIATPAQGLMLFVTDTNGTFTSVGWWGYNGSTWEKLNN